MNKGLRLVGIRMLRPAKGMNILDVGCGTGTHLELYQRYECNLYGLDISPSMLEVAQRRLGDTAKLDLGNATDMPYEENKFDLIIAMLTLHEMPPATRSAAIMAMRRVLKEDGRILLIDFNPGPIQSLQGWTSKVIIFFSEVAAGREHFRNYRHFMANGGLSTLATQHDLRVEKQRILAGGTFAIYLASQESANETGLQEDKQVLRHEVLSHGATASQEDKLSVLTRMVSDTLDQSQNCAQTSFAVLQHEFALDGGGILKALTPFPGIALRGETCGAVIGCLMAIGLVVGRDNLDDWKGYLASLPPSRRFCRRFEEEYGSTACADLLETKLGRRYDLANRFDALKYAAAGGKKTCGKIITSAVHIAAEIIVKKTQPNRESRLG